MISETKIDNFFPTMQLHIEEYCIHRLERNWYGGGILVYMWDDIPSEPFYRGFLHRIKFVMYKMAFKLQL